VVNLINEPTFMDFKPSLCVGLGLSTGLLARVVQTGDVSSPSAARRARTPTRMLAVSKSEC
jgi:hypothetical protein